MMFDDGRVIGMMLNKFSSRKVEFSIIYTMSPRMTFDTSCYYFMKPPLQSLVYKSYLIEFGVSSYKNLPLTRYQHASVTLAEPITTVFF